MISDEDVEAFRSAMPAWWRRGEAQRPEEAADIRRVLGAVALTARAEQAVRERDEARANALHWAEHESETWKAMKADNERLRALVRSAYSEGFTQGTYEATKGGKPWSESRARLALEQTQRQEG